MSENSVLKIIRTCLYAMVVFVPLFFWKWTMNPFIVVKTAIFQSLAGIIILLWVALAIRNKKYRPRMTPLLIGVLVFMFALSVSALLGEDLMMSLWSQETRTIGIVSLWFFTLFYLALVSLKNAIKWQKVWFLSLVTSLFAALGALLAFIPFVDNLFLNQRNIRPWSTFGNPTFLAGYLLFHIFLGIYLWHKSAVGKLGGPASADREPGLLGIARVVPWLALVVAIIDALAIIKTQTRGDVGGLIIGLFLIVVLLAIIKLNLRNHFSFVNSVLKNTWLWLVLFVVVFGGTFFFTRNSSFWNVVPSIERFRNFTTVSAELQNRLIAWQSAAQSFMDHPVLGYGWENFNLAFQKHYNPTLLSNNFSETYWDKPHNVLIEYLMTGGVVGFLAYLGMWVLLLYELKKSEIDGASKIVLFGMLVAYFVRNLVIFDTIGTYLMFFLVMAFIDVRFKETRFREEVEPPHFDGRLSSSRVPLAYPALIISLIPIFFLNWPMVYAAGREYWGPNYYLNKMTTESAWALDEALAVRTPYRDDIRLTFASIVKQSYESASGLEYFDIATIQKRVAEELGTVIRHHPQNYLFYITLADFKNIFYKFDKNYLKDAEALAAKALELSPNRQQVYYVMGRTKLLEGDMEGGLNAFKTAIALNPSAGDPHFYLGLILLELHNVKAGVAEIQRAKELGRVPRAADEAIALANLMGDEVKDYGAAVEYYQQAFDMTAGEMLRKEIRLKIAVAYYLWGKDAEAKKTFEGLFGEIEYRSLPLWPQLEPVFNQLGITLPAPLPPSSVPGKSGIEITPAQ